MSPGGAGRASVPSGGVERGGPAWSSSGDHTRAMLGPGIIAAGVGCRQHVKELTSPAKGAPRVEGVVANGQWARSAVHTVYATSVKVERAPITVLASQYDGAFYDVRREPSGDRCPRGQASTG